MALVTEKNYIGDLVKWEEDAQYSREQITVASGAGVVALGTVLGKLTASTVGAVTADGGNTGNGVAGAATLGALAEIGTYTLTCITAATNAGVFEIKTPSGEQLADDLTVAVAYTSDHINLTIADGATDFAVGDKFTVAVSGSGKYVAANPTLVNGAQKAAAILLTEVDATSADATGVALVREAVVNRNQLTYDASINTAGERQTAVDELAAVGIIAREGA